MKLFLIRHGQVEASQRDRFYGGIEVALSDLGKLQARAAAEAVAGEPIGRLWCSPLSRARFGAECVAESSNQALEPQVIDELREIDRGRWRGYSKSELLGVYPDDLRSHREDPRDWRGHGGESLGDLEARIHRFWEQILKEPAACQVVVSHLFPTRCMVGLAMGLAIEEWRDLELGTGSVTILELDGDQWKLVELGLQPSTDEFS